jgi:hypothetical protein
MAPGAFNVYYRHQVLTPHNVRVVTYGERESSGGVLPEVGDVITGFPGEMSTPITVCVVEVEQLGPEAYQVTVGDVPTFGGARRNVKCACGCGFPTAQVNGYVRGHTPRRGAR